MLPETLNTSSLSNVELFKLESFYQRFVVQRYHEYGDGHFLLACYAAFPVLLTPDLLYQLWLNFSTYNDRGETHEIARVAVADILLSSLCEEVSFEMYEMSPNIRNVLMDYWQQAARGENKLAVPSIEKVATFLLQYIQSYKNSNHKDAQAFRDAQEWMAMTYLQPQKATLMMQNAMQSTISLMRSDQQNRMAKMEMMRLVELSKRAGFRYEMQLVAANQRPSSSLMQMTQTADDLKKLVAGKFENMDMDKLGNYLSDSPNEGSIAMEVPNELIAKIPVKANINSLPRLYAIFIGDFRVEAKKNSIIAFENNQRFELRKIEGYQKIEARAIVNTDVEAIVNAIFEQATENDHIWVYQANGQNHNEVFYNIYDNKSTVNRPLSTIFTFEIPTFEKLPTDRVAFIYGIPLRDIEGQPSLFFQLFEKSKGRLPLQKIVAITSQEISQANKTSPNIYTQELPQLFASQLFVRRPFLSVQNDVLDIQYLLRQLGVFDGSVNGIYNTSTDIALKRFLRENNEENILLNKASVIATLEKQRQDRQKNAKPLYIFVFANPDQKLSYTIQERAMLEGMLRDIIKENNAEAFFLHDPDKQEVMEYFIKPEYRNRMQLFHFSGYDQSTFGETSEMGLYLKENQIITFQDLNQWLDFQEDIQLFFINSCRLKSLAYSLTQRGLNAAIAAEDIVMDDYAFKFAKEFYEDLLKGKDIEMAFKDAKNDDDFQQQQAYSNANIHRSVGPPEYQQQAEFYGSPPNQNNFELLFNWAKKGQTLAWRLSHSDRQKSANQKNINNQNYHLLAISINQYPNQSPLFSEDVIPSIVDLMKSKYFFDDDYVIELYEDSATNRNIRETFSNLSKVLTTDDNLFILLQGQIYWEKNDDEIAWRAYDATVNEKDMYLTDRDLRQLLREIGAKNTILLADMPKPRDFEKSPMTKFPQKLKGKGYWGVFSNNAASNSKESNPFFQRIFQFLTLNNENLSPQILAKALDSKAWQGALFGTNTAPFVLEIKPVFPYNEVYKLLENSKIENAIQMINSYFDTMKLVEPYAFQEFTEITANLPTADPFVSFDEKLENDELKEALLDFIQENYAQQNRSSKKAKKK